MRPRSHAHDACIIRIMLQCRAHPSVSPRNGNEVVLPYNESIVPRGNFRDASDDVAPQTKILDALRKSHFTPINFAEQGACSFDFRRFGTTLWTIGERVNKRHLILSHTREGAPQMRCPGI